MEYVELDDYGLSFAQIVSGPAQVGRIMYYIERAQEGELYHKSGARNTNLKDNIGYAWTTEYMMGLGLIEKRDEIEEGVYNLRTTHDGEQIYYALVPFEVDYDTDEYNSNPETLRDYLINNRPDALKLFEATFRKSPVFLLLRSFLKERGYEFNKSDFMDDFYGVLLEHYDGGSLKREVRTTTARNRVPSLIQTCQLIQYVSEKREGRTTKVCFDRVAIENGVCIFDEEHLETIIEEEATIETEIAQLLDEVSREKYGEMGTVTVTVTVRNPVLQKKIKDRLITEFGSKCAICDIDFTPALIASHIKESVDCSAKEKADGNNGLLLCPNHDLLFDSHYISFDYLTGEIVISNLLTDDDCVRFNISPNMKLKEQHMTQGRSEYLVVHNEKFRQKQG